LRSAITRQDARSDAATLKQTFLSMLNEAKGLAPNYQGQIEQMSTKIDTRSLASLIKTG